MFEELQNFLIISFDEKCILMKVKTYKKIHAHACAAGYSFSSSFILTSPGHAVSRFQVRNVTETREKGV